MSELVNIVKQAIIGNLEDHEFYSNICKCATYGRQNFGDGYVLVDVTPMIEPDGNIEPVPLHQILSMSLPSGATSMIWMDEEYGQKLFEEQVADAIWEKVCLARQECKPDQFVLLSVAMFNNRDSGKYEGSFLASLVSKAKPSSITERQIEKRLRRMVQNRIPLLNLDTANPDCMGKNLEKWLKVIKRFEDEGTPISVMINSSPQFPALLSRSLQSSVVTVSL